MPVQSEIILSASPVFFGWRNRNLLTGGAKEGVVYLMDADHLGGADHQTTLYTSPRYGNDKAACCEGLGIWGGLSTARDLEGQTWLIVPMGGPPAEGAKFPITNGPAPHGSLMAFKVVADPKTQSPVLEPVWVSGDFDMPDPAVIANGVVFALATGSDEVQRGGGRYDGDVVAALGEPAQQFGGLVRRDPAGHAEHDGW